MDRAALITGGTRGIGFGIAEHLARGGFDVAVNGRREAGEVREAIERLEAHGVSALYCRADVSEPADRARMLDEVRERFGRLDVLVNNAGVAPDVRADLLDASEESFDRLMRINLKGPYFLTQAVARWMVERQEANAGSDQPPDRRCIINVGSISATVVSINRGDYCLSKAGIAMATQLWAARLAAFGIDVFEVRPGIIRTDMTAGVREKYDRLIAEGLTLEPRWGEPGDVGRAVAMLARGDLPYATGQVLTLDGGLTMRRL